MQVLLTVTSSYHTLPPRNANVKKLYVAAADTLLSKIIHEAFRSGGVAEGATPPPATT